MSVVAFPIALARRPTPTRIPTIPPSFDAWMSRRVGQAWVVVRHKASARRHLPGRVLLTQDEYADHRALYSAVTGKAPDPFMPLSRDVP